MRHLSDILKETTTVPVLVFKRLVDGTENIDALRTELSINDDTASKIFALCNKHIVLYDDKSIGNQILDPDARKTYEKHKKEVYRFGLEDHKTIERLERDLNNPDKDAFLNAGTDRTDTPLDSDARRAEYDILCACAKISNKEYDDIRCALYITTVNKDTGKEDYDVAVGYDDPDTYDLLKRVNIK